MSSKLFLVTVALIGVTACGKKTSSENTTKEKTESKEMTKPEVMEKEVAFTVAEKYFVKNDVGSLDEPKIETAEEFTGVFGSATVMGEEGKPTPIDFQRQFVIAVTKPSTNMATEIQPVSLLDDGSGNLTLSYKVVEGAEQSHTIQPTLVVIVSKSNDGEVTIKEVE